MKLKYLPNALCILRGLLAVSLIFIPPLSALSITIFIVAGISDMIDGPLARRIKDAKSELGAELDSLADLLLIAVGVFVIMPAFGLWPWINVVILIALGCKFLNAIPGIIKHRKVFFIHTVTSKIFVVILFLAAILCFIFGGNTAMNLFFVGMIAYAFFIVFEETVMIWRLDYPHKNAKGFWEVNRINEEFRKQQESETAVISDSI